MAPLSPPPPGSGRDQNADVEAHPLLTLAEEEEEEDILRQRGHQPSPGDNDGGTKIPPRYHDHVDNGTGRHANTNPQQRGRISSLVHRFQARNPSTIIWLLSAAMFVFTASGMMVMVPMFRLMEDAICRAYFKVPPGAGPIDEAQCKGDQVQSELAWLGGVGTMLASIIGMVAALPYGVLADR